MCMFVVHVPTQQRFNCMCEMHTWLCICYLCTVDVFSTTELQYIAAVLFVSLISKSIVTNWWSPFNIT